MKNKIIVIFIFNFLIVKAQNQCDRYLDFMTSAIEINNFEKAKSDMSAFVACKEDDLSNNNQIIKTLYSIEYATKFNNEGYSIAKKNDGSIIIIDLHFNVVKQLVNVISIQSSLSEKFALVQLKNEKSVYIDRNGNELNLKNDEKYYAYKPFKYGFAIVGFENSYGIIDELGNIILKINTNQDIWLEEVISQNFVKIVVDSKRQILYNQGVGLLNIIDNKIIINPKTNNYDELINFNDKNNLAMLSVFNINDICSGESRAKVTVFDILNNKLIFKDYCLVDRIGKTSTYVLKNDNMFQIYLLENNSFFNNEKFDSFSNTFYFEKDDCCFLQLQKNNYWGGIVVDKNLGIKNYIIPEYDSIFKSRNFFIIEKNKKKGLIDINSNVIIPIDYDEITNWEDNTIFYCRKNNPFQEYYFHITNNGKVSKKEKI